MTYNPFLSMPRRIFFQNNLKLYWEEIVQRFVSKPEGRPMRLSHTLLLVSMLSFGGFMVSMLVHGLVSSPSDIREVPERVQSPRLPTQSVDAPTEAEGNEPLPSCPLVDESEERNASFSSPKDRRPREATEEKPQPTCCCEVRRKRLHLI